MFIVLNAAFWYKKTLKKQLWAVIIFIFSKLIVLSLWRI